LTLFFERGYTGHIGLCSARALYDVADG